MEEGGDIFSQETILDDEEFDFEYYTDLEWQDDINPNESISQIFQSETSSLISLTSAGSSGSSAVWLYFNKDLPHARGFNICKLCPAKYRLTTSMFTLRKHLEKHQLKVPVKKYKAVEDKNQDPFNKEQ
ncbi:unnamed protein product [Rhizophagus irregularis]|nr:unnamed protein product [Rhizophagus irregularis]